MKRLSIIMILLTTAAVLSHADYQKYGFGYASWYGDDLNGKITASGETFDSSKLTAAHRTLPFGSVVEVENLENQAKVIVTINDRGPVMDSRLIDLSKAAADALGFTAAGTAYVKVTVLSLGTNDSTDASTTNAANGSLSGTSGGGNNRVVTLTNYVTLSNRIVPLNEPANTYVQTTNERDVANTYYTGGTNAANGQYIVEEPIDEPTLPVEEPELRLNPWYVTNNTLSNANIVDLNMTDETAFTPDAGPENLWVTNSTPAVTVPVTNGNSYVIADENAVTPETILSNSEAANIEDAMITNEAYREYTIVPTLTVTTQAQRQNTRTTTTTVPSTTTTTVPRRTYFDNGTDSDVVMDAYGNSYTVQVGAFSREQNALTLYDKLKRLGYNVYMKEAVVNNTRFIRVRVGFFATLSEAKVLQVKLKQQGLPTQIVHLRYLTE